MAKRNGWNGLWPVEYHKKSDNFEGVVLDKIVINTTINNVTHFAGIILVWSVCREVNWGRGLVKWEFYWQMDVFSCTISSIKFYCFGANNCILTGTQQNWWLRIVATIIRMSITKRFSWKRSIKRIVIIIQWWNCDEKKRFFSSAWLYLMDWYLTINKNHALPRCKRVCQCYNKCFDVLILLASQVYYHSSWNSWTAN